MGATTLPSSELPASFGELEHLVEGWARPTERERRHLCASKAMPEIEDYYALVGPQLTKIADYLNQFPMAPLPPAENNLFMLAQMYMEVAVCVEFLKGPEMGPIQIPQDRWHIMTV